MEELTVDLQIMKEDMTSSTGICDSWYEVDRKTCTMNSLFSNHVSDLGTATT